MSTRSVINWAIISGFGRPPLRNSNLAGNNWESWGGRESDVIQSRQQKQLGYLSMRQVSSWKVFALVFFTNTIEIRTELVRDKSMPPSRCVVQDCNNGSNPRERIYLHNSPPSSSVLSSWKRFVSSHRKNFNPTGRFVLSLMTVLPGLIIWEDPWNALYRAQFPQYGRKNWKRYTFLSLLRFNISLLH